MAHFRIKEAAEKVGVVPHVLRFWETQFPSLKPNKTGRGQRLYSTEDIEKFLRVKHLLYTEGYSIQGAKKALRGEKDHMNEAVQHEVLREIESELTRIQADLMRL